MTIKHSAIQVLVASVVIAVCICLNSFGQEKLTKEEKKAKRAAEYLAAKEVNLAIVESRQAYAEHAALAADAGADALFLETFTSVLDLVRAVEGARAACDLPVVASFSFHRGFIMGSNDFLVQPEDVLSALQRIGADVIGANCGDGPHTTLDVLELLGNGSEKNCPTCAGSTST